MRTNEDVTKSLMVNYLAKLSRMHFHVDGKRVIVFAEPLSINGGEIELIVCDPHSNDIFRTVLTCSYDYGIQHIKQKIKLYARHMTRVMRGCPVRHHAHKGEARWTTW